MLKNTIRNFFILIIAIYTFYKLLNISPKTKYTKIAYFILSLAISVCAAFLFNNNQALNWLFILFLFFIIMKFSIQIPLPTLYTSTLFSFSFSFICFSISAVITLIILLPIYYQKYEMPLFITRLFIGILHFFLVYFCFRIPRLKKGMSFLYNVSFSNLGSTLCSLLIILIVMFCLSKTYAESFMLIFISLILVFSFLLIYWWNYHITQTYRKFLRKNEIDSLHQLLENRNQEILRLKDENDYLAGLIHRDNKIIPAITKAIIESHENHIPLDLSEWETDSTLYQKLKGLYGERAEALRTHEEKALDFPRTHFDTINATLSYMKSEAQKSDIPFHIVLFDKLESTIPKEITEDDFNHVLSDLLANALNACRDISNASIRVYLGKTEDISTIKTFNTGNIFHIETLKNLGLVRHTTHADTGGSGIGLMDIWKFKEKYKATLLIDEITDGTSAEIYTCVNILFNHKNHYIIQSDRHKELSTYINRPDIMILSKE